MININFDSENLVVDWISFNIEGPANHKAFEGKKLVKD